MLENNQKKELVLLKDLGRIYANENSKQKRRFGLYKCFCGNEFKANSHSIKNGNTKSCGCLGTNNKHNLTKHRLYMTWNAIMQRCYNKNTINYVNYGGRGIKVCNEWLDVQNFVNDMFPTFQEGLSLDRKNNDLGYCPDNCRWTNHFIQQSNKIRLSAKNTSGYRGVTSRGKKCNYRVFVTNKNTTIYLGSYKTALEGAIVRDKYIIEKNLPHTLNGVL